MASCIFRDIKALTALCRVRESRAIRPRETRHAQSGSSLTVQSPHQPKVGQSLQATFKRTAATATWHSCTSDPVAGDSTILPRNADRRPRDSDCIRGGTSVPAQPHHRRQHPAGRHRSSREWVRNRPVHGGHTSDKPRPFFGCEPGGDVTNERRLRDGLRCCRGPRAAPSRSSRAAGRATTRASTVQTPL